MIRQKSKQKDKQHKPSRILAAILFMFLIFTAAGCISNNEQTDAATASETDVPPPVVNKTETPEPEPIVVVTKTPKSEPTETGSNVVYVTPTPRPEPKRYPLDIPVELRGANPEDIRMNVFYCEEVNGRGGIMKIDIEYLPRGKWVQLNLYDHLDRGANTKIAKDKLSYEYSTHYDALWVEEHFNKIGVVISDEEHY